MTGDALTNFRTGIFVSKPVSFKIDHRDCNGRVWSFDGVKDRLIENPLECRFGISNLTCETSASDTKCLTATQIAAAQAVYATPKDLQTGQNAYPGFSLGSETQWMMQEGTLANAFPSLFCKILSLTTSPMTQLHSIGGLISMQSIKELGR